MSRKKVTNNQNLICISSKNRLYYYYLQMFKNLKKIIILILVLIFGIGLGFLMPKNLENVTANYFDSKENNKMSLYKSSSRLKIGTALSTNDLNSKEFETITDQNFNLIVPEYEMKWDKIQKSKNEYDFSKADKLVEYATKTNKQIHGHTLVWYKSVPNWVEPYLESLPQLDRSQALKDILEDYISTVVGRYKGKISSWDVVNEALVDYTKDIKISGKYRTDNIFYKYLGIKDSNIVPEYIELAFKFAHKTDPSIKLFYNDYHVEYIDSEKVSYAGYEKSKNMYEMVSKMLESNIPIDGVGIQSHITNVKRLDTQAFNENNIQDYPLYKTMQAYKRLGLEVKITEMDVIVYAEAPEKPSDEDLEKQANTYQNYLLTCLLFSNCTSFTVWQFSDNYVWYGKNFPGKKEEYHPNIFDRNWKPKPAYFALLELLKEK